VKSKVAAGIARSEDAPGTEEILDGVRGAAQEALEELREVARGIYPPLLADKGLPAALEAQARKFAIPVAVATDGVDRYAQAVEATVYFCAVGAMQNVAAHAHAAAASVRLSASDGDLRFEVTDDGAGFDPASTGYGSGLQGMADRLEALGGDLAVRSSPGTGTVVEGRIPAAQRQDPG